MREYATRRGWTITLQVKEIGSGASQRKRREQLRSGAAPRDRGDMSIPNGSMGRIGHGPGPYRAGSGALTSQTTSFEITARKFFVSNGFTIQPVAPASLPAFFFSGWLSVVNIRIGT